LRAVSIAKLTGVQETIAANRIAVIIGFAAASFGAATISISATAHFRKRAHGITGISAAY
jgi:hypothetical protein